MYQLMHIALELPCLKYFTFFHKRVWLSSFYLLVLSMDYVRLSVLWMRGREVSDRNVLAGYVT